MGGVGVGGALVLRAAQDKGPDGGLHEQLLEDTVGVARGPQVYQTHVPRRSPAPRRRAASARRGAR